MNDDDLRRLGFQPVGCTGPEGIAMTPPDHRPAFEDEGTWTATRTRGEDRPPQVVVFTGTPKVFFLAVCRECNEGRRPLPMPFGTEADRDRWADGHRTTGHTVDTALEIRP